MTEVSWSFVLTEDVVWILLIGEVTVGAKAARLTAPQIRVATSTNAHLISREFPPLVLGSPLRSEITIAIKSTLDDGATTV